MTNARSRQRFAFANVAMFAVAATVACSSDAKLEYPETAKGEVADDYHGTSVNDPYRWLEDDQSAETVAWVKAQNELTFGYLSAIPARDALKERLTALNNYPKYSAPVRRGTKYFFSKNDGLQPQSVMYVQDGLDGEPKVLLDPNTFSTDATTQLSAFSISPNGQFVAYGKAVGGGDWSEYYILDITTGQTLPDKVEWVKVSSPAWAGDGFFYSRYPAPKSGGEITGVNENHQVFFHRVGTAQAQDQLVFEDPAHPQRFHTVSVTEDEKYAVLTVSDRGAGKQGNSLFVRSLGARNPSFTPLIPDITDASYTVLDNIGTSFLVETNHGAPNGRVVLIDPMRREESSWTTVLPEKEQPLQGVSTGGGKIFASYLVDVTTKVSVHARDGSLEHDITLPGLGTAGGFGGLHDDKVLFYSFTSFAYPPTIFKYDVASNTSTEFRKVEIPGFNADDYEVKQEFVPSKDGTKIPVFLTYKKGLKLDGNNPTQLYGYGGFNVTTAPSFSASRIALLENGFVFASANMRGGGEYGETWHEAGTKLKKQNVFDDFIAVADWLVANKYTSNKKLSLLGGSNGGLLVGAVMNQRPALAQAVIAQAGVMDMLRFQKFTIGWNWIADYGTSDNADEFQALYAYSPIHNITPRAYPATLITTADHDDRVIPGHSFKYAATLQAAQTGSAPVLIRVETNSAHGASSVTKQIEISADLYAFLFKNLGVALRSP